MSQMRAFFTSQTISKAKQSPADCRMRLNVVPLTPESLSLLINKKPQSCVIADVDFVWRPVVKPPEKAKRDADFSRGPLHCGAVVAGETRLRADDLFRPFRSLHDIRS